MSDAVVAHGQGAVPRPRTALVGRAVELARVTAMTGEHRLVTITGPGGVGKTRLALEVAWAVQEAGGAVAYVELTAVPDAQLVDAVVASAVGLRPRSNQPLRDQLLVHLVGVAPLLVIDRAEHVVDEVASLVDVFLDAIPDVRVLVTSRAPLGLPGEQQLRLGPLSSDPAADGTPPAVALLVERIRAVRPSFEVAPSAMQSVVDLCRRLDGLPLALELAATRLRSLGVGELMARLDDRFSVLTSAARTGTGRERTLHEVVGWSFDLCSAAERTLWCRLATLPGPFALDLAEQVCADDVDDLDGAAHADGVGMLDLLDGLVSQSVVLLDEHDGVVLYRMLDTIREFGLAQLSADEAARLRRRHYACQLALAEAVCHTWAGPDQAQGLRRLHARQDHLRGALEFASAETDAAAALRLVSALRYHWFAGGNLGEGRVWLDRALGLPTAVAAPPTVLARALWVAAWVSALQGDRDASGSRLRECRAVAGANGDAAALAYADHVAGTTALFSGDLLGAREWFERAAAGHEAAGDDAGLLGMLFQLAMTGSLLENGPLAESAAHRGIELARERRETWGGSYAQWALAFETWRRGDSAGARELCLCSLESKVEFLDDVGSALVLELTAWIAADSEALGEADLALASAARLWRTLGTSARAFGPKLYRLHVHCAERVRTLRPDGRFARGAESGVDAPTPAELLPVLRTHTSAAYQPPPVLVPPTRVELTPREREIAGYVHGGLTNKQIAEKLVVSVRTVDSHVEHVRAKLGVSSRGQITRWVEQNRGTGPTPGSSA